MAKREKKSNPDRIGVGKFWGWQARATSLGCQTIVYGYYMIFCTNALGLNAGIIGTLMLCSRIFDGVTDLIAGYIIDRTNTKLGRARPYEFAIVALWLITMLLFNCPDGLAPVGKYIWVFLCYLLVNAVCQTLLICNQTAYMVRAFPTMNQIVKLNSYGGIVITIGCSIVSMLLPQLVDTTATSSSAWSGVMTMLCIILAIIGMGRFLLVKETIEVKENPEDMITVKGMVEVLKHNKYIYWFLGAYALYNVTLGISGATYYFTYVVGDYSLYTSVAALTMPLMLVMFIFPVMMKKMRLSRIVALGAICGAAGYILNFFAGANIALLMVAGLLTGFGGLPVAYIGGLIVLDCAEYNQLIGLPRSESVMTAFQSVGSKIGQGLGSAVYGMLLAAAGFSGSAVAQSESAITMIKLGYSLIPAAAFVLLAVCMFAYKLENVLPGLREKAAAKAAE